jgi:hypothetical protein
MLLSNPGLHLALLGNPKRRGKKPSFGFASRKLWTQAKRRAIARVGRSFKIKGGGRYKVHSSGSTGYHRVGRPKIHAPGISWSGRKGGIRYSATIRRGGRSTFARFTNPRRHHSRRKSHMRRNPINEIVANAKSIPDAVKDTFTGSNKIKAIGFAAGAGIASFMLGGMLIKMAKDKGPAAVQNLLTDADANSMKVRVVSGITPLVIGLVASCFIKDRGLKTAVIAGSAIAAAVEIAKPGMVGDAVAKLTGGAKKAASAAGAPAVAQTIAKVEEQAKGAGLLGAYADVPNYQGSAGLAGLSEYAVVPGYSGSGDYVDAPQYSGSGDYVDAPGYSGSAGIGQDEMFSGDDGLASDALAADDTVLAGLGTYLQDSVAAQSGSYLN